MLWMLLCVLWSEGRPWLERRWSNAVSETHLLLSKDSHWILERYNCCQLKDRFVKMQKSRHTKCRTYLIGPILLASYWHGDPTLDSVHPLVFLLSNIPTLTFLSCAISPDVEKCLSYLKWQTYCNARECKNYCKELLWGVSLLQFWVLFAIYHNVLYLQETLWAFASSAIKSAPLMSWFSRSSPLMFLRVTRSSLSTESALFSSNNQIFHSNCPLSL